jgi:hypothetical protein
MSIHSCLTSNSEGIAGIKVAIGYEDGRVEVWTLQDGISWRDPSDARVGSSPWEKVYEGKKHNEASKFMSSKD